MTRVQYLLSEMRAASLRLQLLQADVDAIALALKGGVVTPEQAIDLLHDVDVFAYIEPTVPTTPAPRQETAVST
jgi:hypothetical protein